MPEIYYETEKFDYEIIRRKKKNISITITPDAKVKITAPFHANDAVIHDIAYKKAKWIISKLKMVKESSSRPVDKLYCDGEKVLYLGESCSLKVIKLHRHKGSINLKDKCIEVIVSESVDFKDQQNVVKEMLIMWYKKEADKVLKERTAIYSERLNLYPKCIRIKEQKTIWGSCSSLSNINYNWRLIMAPISVIDYIVVHELCHLVHRDHSSRFWGLVEQTIPDYKKEKEWLKNNGRSLMI